MKLPKWLWTIGRSVLICIAAAAIDAGLAYTPAYNELAGAAFAVQQGRLQTQATGNPDSSMVVVDLASLIAQRPGAATGAPLPEESANQLAPQWDGLSFCLEKILRAKPHAILVDWQLGLGKDFVVQEAKRFEYQKNVPQETRDAYLRLMTTIRNAKCVYFVADDANERVVAKLPAFPLEGVQEYAIHASEFPAVIGPYVALAPAKNEEPGLPLATSDYLLKKWGWEDRLEHEESKLYGLFHAEGEMAHKEGFWMDLGQAPNLIRNSVGVRFPDLDKPEVQGRLTGKVVILGDVHSSLRWDTFTAPIPKDLTRQTPEGPEVVTRAGGAILTGSSLLTRKNGLLYAAHEGVSEWLLVFLFSLVVLSFSYTIGHVRTKGKEDHQSELDRLSIELAAMILSVLFVLAMVWGTPWTRILLVGFPVWITTRMVDLSVTFVLLRRHLRNHSHHDDVHKK